MITQHTTNALVTYEAIKNNVPEKSGAGTSIRGSNSDFPRTCTYEGFINYQTRAFNDNKEVIWLTLCIENMELIFVISSYIKNRHFKFAICTFMNTSLAWWNDNTKTMDNDSTYATNWEEINLMLIEKYCPIDEI